ncbi:MAG: hypothetical protein H6719_22020 [Sandaracinaceae bacterium]|nr:hypothetical protein [Sandaracinaceae bacterium]
MAALTLEDLVAMDADALDHTMRNGYPIDEDVLADREYDGVSLNLPSLVERMTWTKFCKVFLREPDGSLRGWNCKVDQTPLTEPWVLTKGKDGQPITYGHYRVVPCDGYRMPRPYDAGVMLDYGLGRNPRTDPTGAVRDPLLAVNEGDSALLLGWSYVDAKITTVGTPSFFALRRGVPLSHRISPPRG